VILGFVFFGTHERSTTASTNAPAPTSQTHAGACASGAQRTQAITAKQRGEPRCSVDGLHAAEAHAAGAIAGVGAAIA
jgi:hypothetical protein